MFRTSMLTSLLVVVHSSKFGRLMFHVPSPRIEPTKMVPRRILEHLTMTAKMLQSISFLFSGYSRCSFTQLTAFFCSCFEDCYCRLTSTWPAKFEARWAYPTSHSPAIGTYDSPSRCQAAAEFDPSRLRVH